MLITGNEVEELPVLKYSDIYTNEASLKYFLVQALASTSLLCLGIIKFLINQIIITGSVHSYAIITPLLIKIGAAPLH
jgi:NADH-ubiquinone oxidoreductase chain 2